MDVRKASLLVKYLGTDISTNISKDLLTFSYTDNLSNQSDSVSITLKDEKKTWINDWFPEKNDTIECAIKTLNWRKENDQQLLNCGHFFIDQPEFSGRPRTLTINAIANPLNLNFSQTPKTKSWRNISLKNIGADIAHKAGLKFQYLAMSNPVFQVIQQTEISDLAFLSELVEKEGLALKLTGDTLVIFDESDFEKKIAVTTISEEDSILLDYSFTSSLANTAYAGVRISYYDSKLESTIEYLYSIREIDFEKDKIYTLNTRVNSQTEAIRLAKKTLRQLNKNEFTASLKIIGNLDLSSGLCVNLNDFGKFDGKYIITQLNHVVGGGFSTSLQLRKVLEGY